MKLLKLTLAAICALALWQPAASQPTSAPTKSNAPTMSNAPTGSPESDPDATPPPTPGPSSRPSPAPVAVSFRPFRHLLFLEPFISHVALLFCFSPIPTACAAAAADGAAGAAGATGAAADACAVAAGDATACGGI